MTLLINLLPWRQRQRQQHVRYWGLIAAGCLLLVMLAGMGAPGLVRWETEQQHLEGNRLSLLDSVLQRKYREGLEIEKRQQLQAKREAQRQSVKDWESWLTRLANQLPASAWLTSLSVRNGQVLMKGNAVQPADIQVMETVFRQLHGVSAVETGALQHDGAGKLMFTFTLKLPEASDVAPD